MYTEIPDDLVFDDDDLDTVLYATDAAPPSPADVLDACRGRDRLPEEWRKPVVAILARNPRKARALTATVLADIIDHEALAVTAGRDRPRDLLSLARLCQVAQRPAQAEAAYRQALRHAGDPADLPLEERQEAMRDLAALLDQAGRAAEANAERTLAKALPLLTDPTTGGLVQVRSLALECFLDEEYESAERLYRALLDRRFQEPGTWVHLTRVLLMQDRVGPAREAIARACKRMRRVDGPDETPHYIRPRLLFLRILFAMLAGKRYAPLVTQLKRELQNNPEQETWSIAPVIAHLQPGLSPADADLLTAIAAAINDADQRDRLDRFAVWAAGG